MRIALIVPGGVDRTGEVRVIPALLGLMAHLSLNNEVHVFALNQEEHPATWQLAGAQVTNIGRHHTRLRALCAIRRSHRLAPFDVVHAIWSGMGGLLAVVAAKLLGTPSLIHVAGGELVAMPEIGYGGMQTWRGRLREPRLLRAASAVTAASAPIIEALSRLGVAAHCVPLGVDLSVWPVRAPVARDPRRKPRLIHVATLNRVKDQTTLLRALADLAGCGVEFEMSIVGEDILGGRIQALARRLGLMDRIRFEGFLTQSRLRPLMDSADLLVMSSRHETGPLVMLEAAIAGVPTVGTAVGHMAEWAPQAALAVPVGDWAQLSRAIRGMLEDDARRLRIALNAQQRAVRQDAANTARRFLELYASSINAAPPRMSASAENESPVD